MGVVSSSQPSVSITVGPELYTVHVHVQVEIVKKVCFIWDYNNIIVCDRGDTKKKFNYYH